MKIQDAPILRFLGKIWFGSCMFLVHTYTAVTTYIIYVSGFKGGDVWSAAMYGEVAFCTAATFDALITKRNQIAVFWDTLLHLFFLMEPSRQKAIRRYSNIFFVVIGLYLLVSLICFLIVPESDFGRKMFSDVWNSTFRYGDPERHVDQLMSLSFLHVVLVWYTTITPWAFFPMVFFILCRILQELVEVFNHSVLVVTTAEYVITFDHIRELRVQYRNTREVVQAFNDIFTYFLFFWYVTTLVSTYLGILNIILMYTQRNDIGMVYVTALYFHVIWVMLGIIFVVSRVSEKAEQSLLRVQELTHRVPFSLYSTMDLFLTQLAKPMIGLTAGNDFLMTRSLCLSLMGTTVSYIIICIQMNPQAMKALRS